jgi:hypothetical protein
MLNLMRSAADPRSLFRSLVAEAVDETVGLAVLYGFLRYGRRPPLKGAVGEDFIHLHCGDVGRFFQPAPAAVDLSASLKEIRAAAAYRVYDLRFPSPVQGPFRRNNVVHTRLWRSSTPSSDLTVVGVDGIVQVNSLWFEHLARELCPAGIDVLMMDAPFNHRRTPPGYRPGQLIVGGNLDHQLSVMRQAVLDLWTAIRSLQQQGRRVGVLGISYGGWMSLMSSVVADDLEFVTALAPPVDIFRLLTEGGAVVRAIRRGLGYGPLDRAALEHAARALNLTCWKPRLDPTRITLHAAEYDRFVPPRRIEELARRWGARLRTHADGHIGLCANRRYTREVAADILHAEGRT